ncbi:unnamed protein product [Schistocephalus solidus]|uniref:Uncharacterized protein n=1 Tax=Schistocephalus solidus TaxID=70667 RepID=A0A183TF80_SCHSO|nr:unnamed protein product [Schistocephalus solidus]
MFMVFYLSALKEEYKLCYACVLEMSIILREQLDENEKKRNRDPSEIFDEIDKELFQTGRQPETLGQESDSHEKMEKSVELDGKQSAAAQKDGVSSPQADLNEWNEAKYETSRPPLLSDNKSKNKRLLPQISSSDLNHFQKANYEGKKARKLPPIKVYWADNSSTQVSPLSAHVISRVPQLSSNCTRKLPIITSLHNPYFTLVPNSHRRHLPDIRLTRHRRKLPFIGSIIENPLNVHEFEDDTNEQFDNAVYAKPIRESFDISCISRKAGQRKEQRQQLLDDNNECRCSTAHLSLLPKRKTTSQVPRQPLLQDQRSIDSNSCAHGILPPTLVRTETETSYLTSSLGNSPSPKYIKDDQLGVL